MDPNNNNESSELINKQFSYINISEDNGDAVQLKNLNDENSKNDNNVNDSNIIIEEPNNNENDKIEINNNNNNSSNPKPKVRQSNIELLRIISMFLIVCHHFSHYGHFNFSPDKITLNRLWVQFLSIGGKISVNIYVMISGYFLINSKNVKINKFLKLELQLITYSLLKLVIGLLTKKITFSFKVLVYYMFPVTYDIWWFPTTYMILYLIFPVINSCVHALNRVTYRNYLIFMAIIWSVIPTLIVKDVYLCNNLVWFTFLYLIAGYLRKYSIGENTKSTKWIVYGVLIGLTIYLLSIICDIIGLFYAEAAKGSGYLIGYSMVPDLIASVLILIGFTRINIQNKFINFISTTTFGIYLLHDGEITRPWIWHDILKVETYTNSNLLIPYSIFAIVSVFVVGSIIEIIRIYTIEKLYMKLVDFISKKLDHLIEKFTNWKLVQKL